MWRWPHQENSTTQALALLSTLTGTSGKRFAWRMNAYRGGSKSKPCLIRFPEVDDVVVANNSPLSFGAGGAALFMERFRILKGDFEIDFEGQEFSIGENIIVQIGQMRRKQVILSEFCLIRWAASASPEPSPAAEELLNKLALPDELELVSVDFSTISPTVPFESRHLALQLVQLFDDTIAGSEI